MLREKVLSALARQPSLPGPPEQGANDAPFRIEISTPSRRLAADLSRYYDADGAREKDDASYPRFDQHDRRGASHHNHAANRDTSQMGMDELRVHLLRQVQSARLSLQKQQEQTSPSAEEHQWEYPHPYSRGTASHDYYPAPAPQGPTTGALPRPREDLLAELRHITQRSSAPSHFGAHHHATTNQLYLKTTDSIGHNDYSTSSNSPRSSLQRYFQPPHHAGHSSSSSSLRERQ